MNSGIVGLFSLTSFLAAALLFSVQPMIGKMVVPVAGGTPAVWNTCLVYFQMVLLCGYLITHRVGTGQGRELRRVAAFYLASLATLLALGYYVQPFAIQTRIPSWNSARLGPATGLLGTLCFSATLPLVMVAATAPLLQCWFALSGHPRAHDPYFLYAASNCGSLLALLAYPFVIEPNLGLRVQGQVWRTGFLILAMLVLGCGLLARRLSRSGAVGDEAHDRAARPDSRRGHADLDSVTNPPLVTRLRWLVLVFVPSSWLMGVTTYLTTDMASIPLFWIMPLALYLLSFIVAFARMAAQVVRAANALLPYLVLLLVLVLSAGLGHVLWIPLHLLVFFVGSVACHGALARSRPSVRHASAFYVTIATGGLLGGVWTALVAPLVFNRVVEYPLAVVLACLVAPGIKCRQEGRALKELAGDWIFAGIVFVLVSIVATNQLGLADSVVGVLGVMIASGMGILACLTAGRRPFRFALTAASVLAASGLSPGPMGRLLHIERNFFGVIRVTYDAERNAHRLFHGSTLHGQQSLNPALRPKPSTYYARSGPIGQVFEALQSRLLKPGTRVAIVGLGVGTLACYSQPGQRWTFYEIDGAMERIARDPRFFTYLQDNRDALVNVVLGDARIRLGDAPNGAYRLIVLDAFSSDVIPVHLLSIEAIRLYRRKLAEGGVLALNLTNRYLDLEPVMGRQAENEGLTCRIRYDLEVSAVEKRAGKQPSIWAVIAAAERDLGILAADPRWRSPAPRIGAAVWTDDYSDLASYLILTPSQRWSRQSRGWPRVQAAVFHEP
jgi:hypothetical protein